MTTCVTVKLGDDMVHISSKLVSWLFIQYNASSQRNLGLARGVQGLFDVVTNYSIIVI